MTSWQLLLPSSSGRITPWVPATRLQAAGKVYVIAFSIAFLVCTLALAGEAQQGADPWQAHVNIGAKAFHQGRFVDAEQALLAAVREAERFSPKDPRLPRSLNMLANLYGEWGKFDQAEPLLQRALTIQEKSLGPEHPELAMTLNNLGEYYSDRRKWREDEEFHKRAIKIRENGREPAERSELAISLNNLAEVYKAQGRYGDALPLLKRSVEIIEAAVGRTDRQLGIALDNLGSLYHHMGKYKEAETYQRGSRAIFDRQGTPADRATVLNNLGATNAAQGHFNEAEPLYRQSLALREQIFGPDHPVVAETLRAYAAVLRKLQRGAEAALLENRAQSIRARGR